MQLNAVPNFVICSIALVVNVFILAGYFSKRQLRNDRSNRHVMSVLTSHVAISLSLITAVIATAFDASLHGQFMPLMEFSYYCNLLNMVTFSVERYVCFIYPFNYLHMSRKSRLVLLFSSWVLAIGVTAVKIIFNFKAIFILLLVITTVVLVYTNVKIFRTVLAQRRRIQSEISSVAIITREEGRNAAEEGRKQVQLSYACFGSTSSLLLLTLPSVIYGGVRREMDAGSYTLGAIANLNSIFDPICFLSFNSLLRMQLLDLCKAPFTRLQSTFCCKKKDVEQPTV